MFSTSRRGLRIVIDCADPRPLLELQRRPWPRGVRVRCRRVACVRDGRLDSVLQAEVHLSARCDTHDVGAWLSACFAASQAPWYVDGVPAGGCAAPASVRDAREILLRFAL